MKRFIIISVACAIVAGVLFKGSFGHGMIVISLGLFIGAPVALFMALWWVISLKRAGMVSDGLKTTFSTFVTIGASLLFSLGVGSALHHWSVYETRAFVAELVPKLDDYRAAHGAFPRSLSDLGVVECPSLLAGAGGYSSDLDHFKFEYWDASGMMDGYSFDSSSRKWLHFD